MTPTSSSTPSSAALKLNDAQTANLALQPVRYSDQGHCKNKDVMTAVADALADKSCSDALITAILKNAWLHDYQPELNELITNIEARHGAGAVRFSDNVRRMLADEHIDLVQNSDGTVQLEKSIAVKSNPRRADLIGSTLDTILPTTLCKLISSYDDEIEIGEKNRKLIVAIMETGDSAAKSSVIAAASHQRQISYLNELFQNKPLNLSGIDLSNLDLTGIDLAHAEVSFANLQNCCLADARLNFTRLTGSNLNQANLSRANLTHACLNNARLIAANLFGANLTGTTLIRACLLCANLEQATLCNSISFHVLPTLNFSNYIESRYGKNRLSPLVLLHRKQLQAPLDVLVVPTLSEMPSRSDDSSSRLTPLVITENEKRLVLASGLVMKDYGDGTIQLSRGLTVQHDPLRSSVIDSTLLRIFPKELTDLISSYDDDIEISQQNETAILDILKSADQSAKGLLIGSACRQFKLIYLNQIFSTLRQQGFKLNLSRVDLSNLNLTGLNLNNINLSYAAMHGCNLFQVTLHQANLIKTNFNGASLIKADFTGATMSGASLMQADLTGAILNQANLVGAVLKFAKLLDAELQGGTNLTNAYLDYASLELTNLTGAVMINASLTHVNMYGTKLGRANLTNAKLMHARVANATMSSVNLSHADLSRATIDDTILIDAPKLAGTIWTGVRATKILTDPATKRLLPASIRPQCLD